MVLAGAARVLSARPYDYGYDQLPAAKAKLTIDQVIQAVEKPGSKIVSVETLLAWIKSVSPTLLDHYTLVRDSESLQKASDVHPRAIAFGDDARLMVTFNGDPSQAGYETVELIQVRESKGVGVHYEFREISFATKPGETPRGHVSEINPSSCYRCHGAPLRPIWDQYEIWTGAYGKYDDAIRDFDEKYQYKGESTEHVAEMRAELAAFKKYQAIRENHSRYKFLRVSADSPVSPYGPTHRPYPRSLRPNLELTSFLTEWHSKRMAGMILDRKACFAKYGAALVHDLLQCDASAEQGNLTVQARERIGKMFPMLPQVRWHRLGNPVFSKPAQFYLPLFGIEARDWNPQKRTEEWNYYEGSVNSSFADFVAQKLYAEMRSAAPEMPNLNLYAYRTNEPIRPGAATPEGYVSHDTIYEAACVALSERMKQAVEAKDDCASPVGTATHAPPEALRTCVSCHDGTTSAPRIDWRRGMYAARSPQLSHLAARLRARDATRMPPTRALTERETQQILKFLTSADAPL